MIKDSCIEKAYAIAKECYQKFSIDTDTAIDRFAIPISVQCWQGDDIGGFEKVKGAAGGGILATGNYPGKAPASPDKQFPADHVEAFYVPQGCVVNCRPGVWHHAAYSVTDKPVNVLIVLPERTYVNDAYGLTLEKKQQIKLEL